MTVYVRGCLFMCLLLAVPILWGESADCNTPVLIASDGRATQSTIPQGATYWYGIYAQAGHSYSVEFMSAADNTANLTKPQFSTISVYGPNDALALCRGSSTVAVTQNSGYAPVIMKNLNGAGRRVSFTAQSAGLYVLSVTNNAASGGYTFRAVDTTLYNLRWSTWGGYYNQWSITNVSDMTITGCLSIFDGSSHVLIAVQFSIPPGAQITRFSGSQDLNLPWNTAGYAIFTHNGPPNAMIADSYMISPNGAIVTYTKFEGIGSR